MTISFIRTMFEISVSVLKVHFFPTVQFSNDVFSAIAVCSATAQLFICFDLFLVGVEISSGAKKI